MSTDNIFFRGEIKYLHTPSYLELCAMRIHLHMSAQLHAMQ